MFNITEVSAVEGLAEAFATYARPYRQARAESSLIKLARDLH